MVEIVKATEKEFAAVETWRRASGRVGALTEAIRALSVGDVFRIKNHPHKTSVNRSCNYLPLLHSKAHQSQVKINVRHDGPDLLVKRTA